MEKNVHTGHRERIKKKFQQNFNFDNLEEHEILEMLLFHCYTRCNTNDIAHKLIDKFGSIDKVLKAPFETLVQSKIIGENPALSLKFFNALNIYLYTKQTDSEINFYDIPALKEFVKDTFYGLGYETFKLYFTDNSYKIKGYTDISTGLGNSVELRLREITKTVLNSECNYFFVAHNHPDADSTPSEQDIILTRKMISHLKTMDIHLLDHFVVGKDDIKSMRQEGLIYDHEM